MTVLSTLRRAAVVAASTGLAAALLVALTGSAPAEASGRQVGHVFVINLENKGFTETFGATSPAPYLSKTLVAKGNLLTNYYGIAHNSLPNYLAQISGQAPNVQTQADCQFYTQFVGAGTVAPQQAVGTGCVYPSSVRTLADQLTSTGRSWKGYMEDMGNIPSREAATCGHPTLNSRDGTQSAVVGDQYASRHDPFVYFSSITGNASYCSSHVVGLSRLTGDLRTVGTTPALSYITPNLCHDGHDSPCVDGQPGGLVSADAWLKTWVPKIMAAPAFQKDGLLVITFDESDGPQEDSSACCGEVPGPNSPVPGITGPGGGRVGAVVLGPSVKPGSRSNQTYNHYSLLGSIEDLFGLPHLGFAATVTHRFGADVYTARR